MSPRRATNLLLSVILTLPLVVTAGPAAASTTFRDVAGSPHAPAVTALAAEGIVAGCATGRYCPASDLTRGQVATIIFRALELEPVAGGSRFSDTAGSVHRQAIDAIAEAGVTAGCRTGRFCPNDSITRGELATMLFRALGLAKAPSGTYFSDVAGTHRPAIDAMAHGGLAAGCSLVEFCPSRSLSRAQAATFIARGLDLVPRVRLAPYADRLAEHRAQTVQARSTTAAQRAVEVAKAQVGKPYQWGGNGPGSFDCSGLTRYAWNAAGVQLPRTSRDQYAGTKRISRSQLQPGDLVFYYSPIGHVAMYIGDGRVVEAPLSGSNVRIRNDGLTRSGIVGYGRPS